MDRSPNGDREPVGAALPRSGNPPNSPPSSSPASPDPKVAEQLMIMHEECLKGSYESIENLWKFVSQRKRVINDDDDDESSDEEATDMMVDEPVVSKMAVEKPKPKEMPYEDGWSVV